ncbi:UDP-N-acetylglucosamine 1-carboxyvinyltransferase [Anoxybacter fermentans]|uniref:UDP-N-acetylglucosamine 1-carboxyvinyltransferase n=1 Tax=Anoxybacter fermentans TaxID=1323375 RepID=A0A3S9T0E9_9FIRM|nr:UDP-N-acetylglucosamine 1-carboxyvinyltransferase [Anoxybacter fermentans]AZR73985.1 UDP-N-acetylglucosamine 1-carboxyvinyltransferase [Anoxybacter fermentans]
MEKLLITGGEQLKGEIPVSGAKNAALPIICATLMVEGESILKDIPQLRDVYNLKEILKSLGAKVTFNNNEMRVNPDTINAFEAPYELVRKLRASYYILGALLPRLGQVRCALPGGCQIGNRPIDLHLKGFRALGAEVYIDHGIVEVKAKKLQGNRIYLDYPSVGATINILLAATLAEGQTVIENAAREPEIVDLANYLNFAGARIRGVGTDVIKVEGVKKLHGVEHRIIPDRIEAGTYMIAAAITRGDVFVRNVLSEHLKSLIAKMKEMGVDIEEEIEGVRVSVNRPLKGVDIKTLPHPGFPTDLQAQMMALLTQVNGPSLVIETVWENRFMHVDELKRMGADIKLDGRAALIKPAPLTGAKVTATDLRAGAALILAGLAAQGETEVSNIYHIQRGYENIEDKLRGIGAKIKRVSE